MKWLAISMVLVAVRFTLPPSRIRLEDMDLDKLSNLQLVAAKASLFVLKQETHDYLLFKVGRIEIGGGDLVVVGLPVFGKWYRW